MDADTPYYDALGRFLAMYARTEAVAQILLWHISRVDADTARIIWPSLRVKQITDTVRKLYRGRGETLPAQLDEALGHFNTITDVRDDAVHYAPKADERGNLFANNLHQQFHLPEPVTRALSIPLLHALTSDLAVIWCRIAVHLPSSNPAYQKQYEEAAETARTPFLYKSPQPTKKHRG